MKKKKKDLLPLSLSERELVEVANKVCADWVSARVCNHTVQPGQNKTEVYDAFAVQNETLQPGQGLIRRSDDNSSDI